MISDKGFTVRPRPPQVTDEPVDSSAPGWTRADLRDAIEHAQVLAYDRQYRSVQVLDVNMRCWAEFHLLWSVP